MADSSPARLSRWSRAPTAVHALRPPAQDPEGFREDVARLVETIRPKMVIPTCEEVFHLASAREDGVDVGSLFAPDLATLDRLHGKDTFAVSAWELGLDVPPTEILRSEADVHAVDPSGKVLKACYSRFGAGTLVKPSADQAKGVHPTRERPWIAQDFVDGEEHSSYAIAVDGRITAFAAYRSTMRLGGGAGYAFQPAGRQVHDRMLEASSRLVAHLGMTGQISLDAIDDGARTWLIECNPRATSGAHLLSGDGRIARAMAGESTKGCLRGRSHNLPMMLSHGVRRPMGLPAALSSGRDVVGAPGDRMPVLGAMMDAASFALQARRRGTTLTGATTQDIEWNGSR
jgi:hypothetical protein